MSSRALSICSLVCSTCLMIRLHNSADCSVWCFNSSSSSADALKALDRSHDRCPQSQRMRNKIRKTIYACRIDPIPQRGMVAASALRECSSRIYSLFTMTNSVTYRRPDGRQSAKPDKFRGSGGARRDRTDDLKLAKLPLSQLSYGPFFESLRRRRRRPSPWLRATGRGGRSALRTFGPKSRRKMTGGPGRI
jgi:hypothetical protein